MNKVRLKSEISGKSIDELFDYQSKEKINQCFTIEDNRSFYKNNEFLISKHLDLNETFNPVIFGNIYLFNIEKISNNIDQKYYFVSKSNYPSLKISYHNYRLNPNSKEREVPTWISLYNFNFEKNDIKEKNNMEKRKKRNKNFFLKNKKNNYELNVGDVIKLGRVSLIVTKIHLQKSKKNNNETCADNKLNKKSNEKINNYVNNNNIIKDIYQDYHYKVINNKINIDKNILKKFTFNSNEQTLNNDNNNNNSFKGELINEENNDNKNGNNNYRYSSDKMIKQISDLIKDESLTSKENKNQDKKKINNTYNFEINEKLSFNNANNRENIEISKEIKSTSERNNICRICYCDEQEMSSPLINLCNCSGDVKYIHLKCLSHWLKTKSKLLFYSNDICKQLCFNKINCEICKEKFPEIVFDLTKKKTYQVYKPEEIVSSLNNIYNNYIIFESFELINQRKVIYIISFDQKNSITIGRGQDCDLRLTDVTVSRIHCILLRTKDNKIMLKDVGSKFGTLILLQAKKILITNKILAIQIGKIYLNLNTQYFSLNCLCKIFYNLCCFFCTKKNKSKLIHKKSSTNFSNNNKAKNDNLNESNYNMININNFINLNDNTFDYNIVNMRNITIEDIIDIKFQYDDNISNQYLKNKYNDINQLVNKLYVSDKNSKKNMSNLESFNNLNMAS